MMSSIVCRSSEPEPEDPPRGEDQAGECGAQGGSHGAQGPAPQVGSFLLFLIWRKYRELTNISVFCIAVTAMFRICDILVRIRILESVPFSKFLSLFIFQFTLTSFFKNKK